MPDAFDICARALAGALGVRSFTLLCLVSVSAVVVQQWRAGNRDPAAMLGRAGLAMIAGAGVWLVLRALSFVMMRDFGTTAFIERLSELERAGIVVLWMVVFGVASFFSAIAAFGPARAVSRKAPPVPHEAAALRARADSE